MTEGHQKRLQLSNKIFVQQIIRIQYNKNWETLLAYLLRTKVSCKAAEIAATRSLKAQSFFVCHATYKAFFRKNPTYWDYYIMSNSLTCIIAHLNCGICIVIRYKHNLIHLFIQSLNPILKILKFKYLQIRHKNLVTNWPQRHNLFHENPLTARPPWQLVTPEISHEYWGCSSNSPPLMHGDQILHPLEDW